MAANGWQGLWKVAQMAVNPLTGKLPNFSDEADMMEKVAAALNAPVGENESDHDILMANADTNSNANANNNNGNDDDDDTPAPATAARGGEKEVTKHQEERRKRAFLVRCMLSEYILQKYGRVVDPSEIMHTWQNDDFEIIWDDVLIPGRRAWPEMSIGETLPGHMATIEAWLDAGDIAIIFYDDLDVAPEKRPQQAYTKAGMPFKSRAQLAAEEEEIRNSILSIRQRGQQPAQDEDIRVSEEDTQMLEDDLTLANSLEFAPQAVLEGAGFALPVPMEHFGMPFHAVAGNNTEIGYGDFGPGFQ